MTLRSIPVGMYHHVNHNSGDFVTVSVENFRRQMEWLKRENYETLSAETFLAALRGTHRPSRRSFVLTFDDAWLDVYTHAFPILKEFGHRFIVFVVGDWTEQASQQQIKAGRDESFPTHKQSEICVRQNLAGMVVCAWRHLQEMQESGLASIENHSSRHRKSPGLAPGELAGDLLRCGELIRSRIGRESRHFCWPFGRYTKAGMRIVREAGFETTYLVRRGVNLAGGNSFKVKRFTVDDRNEEWLRRQLGIFSNPVAGYLYSRLKPDRWFRRGKT